jgi:hypothetical protein
MATYLELQSASQDAQLRQKIAVACVVAAEAIRIEDPATPNHSARIVWARDVYAAPGNAADKMMWPVLAQNKAATLAQITGASDATIQTAVDAAVAVFL